MLSEMTMNCLVWNKRQVIEYHKSIALVTVEGSFVINIKFIDEALFESSYEIERTPLPAPPREPGPTGHGRFLHRAGPRHGHNDDPERFWVRMAHLGVSSLLPLGLKRPVVSRLQMEAACCGEVRSLSSRHRYQYLQMPSQ